MFKYFYNEREQDIFPFFGVTGIFLQLSFSFPTFYISPENYQLGYFEYYTLKVVFWSYLILILSFYFFRGKQIKSIYFNPIGVGAPVKEVKITAIVFLVLYYGSKILNIAAIEHIGNAGLFIFLGTFLYLLNKKYTLTLAEKSIFYVTVIYEYTDRLLDGLLSSGALFALFLIIIEYYSRGNLKRIALWFTPFIIIYFLISPIKGAYRQMVWFSGVDYSILDRGLLINELNKEQGVNLYQERDNVKDEKETFYFRFSYQASALNKVLVETPSNVPYWNGSSYSIFSKFIPRFLWPNKPKEDMGQRFGQAYNILEVSDNRTSMNTPILTEMYMNFGYLGIVFGMTILGLIYALLNNFFNNAQIKDSSKAYSLAIIFPLMVHESNFTLQFGNVPLLLITIYIITKILQQRKRAVYSV